MTTTDGAIGNLQWLTKGSQSDGAIGGLNSLCVVVVLQIDRLIVCLYIHQ